MDPEHSLQDRFVDPLVSFPLEPTTVRYQVLAFLSCMTFILYLDRVCIGQAATAIQRDLDISDTAMGFIFGAFTLSYGLFEVPTGRLGDRYGSRQILTRIVVWWSAFTILTGAATGFWMLLVVRFLFGVGEAGALPNATRVVARWFPPSKRGTAQGIVTTAMMVGGAVSPAAAAALILWLGWRWSFVLFGALGTLWALAFYYWFRDDPRHHPAVNDEEIRVIQGDPTSDAEPEGHPPIPWEVVLPSGNVWLLGGLMSCGAAVFYMLISWYPKYLQAGRQVEETLSGQLASLVLAGGALGCLLGGILTDQLMRRTGSARWSRCYVGSFSFAVGGVAMLLSLHCNSPLLAACCTSITIFCVQLQIPAWWATVIGISGRHVGALAGLMNSLGCIGAIASQLFLGSLADWLGEQGYTGRSRWDPGFYVYSIIMVLGALLWLLVRPERSVVDLTPEPEPLADAVPE